MVNTRLSVLFIATVALPGCQRDDALTEVTGGVTRDSAGVQIVEYLSLPHNVPQWTISSTPAVVIGTVDGDVNTAFGRVSGFAEGPNAEIAIADAQAQEVRAFDQNGRYLWTAGREGNGPGEFTSLASVFWMGDSLVAVNHFSRSLAIFSSTGEFGRTVMVGPPTRAGYGSPIVRGVLSNGDLVIAAAEDFNPGDAMGYRRDEFVLQLYTPDGTPRVELGLFPDVELMIEGMQGRVIARPVPMGRSTVVTGRDEAVVAATTDRFEYRRYDPSGALTQIVRVAVEPQRVDDEVRSRYVELELRGIDAKDRRAARAGIENRTLPDALGALNEIQIDPDGNVWLEEFVMPDEATRARWWVFNADGDFVASVNIPPDLVQIRIGKDHIIGLAFDSMGVALIQKHRIHRDVEVLTRL